MKSKWDETQRGFDMPNFSSEIALERSSEPPKDAPRIYLSHLRIGEHGTGS